MFARRIAVVGTGYVGLTTGACLASLGHRVVCADVDEAKVERLRAGEIGIREDGLAELVSEGIAAGRLSFVVGAGAALKELEADGTPVEVMFLCVPTSMGVGGIADLAAVEAVIEETRAALPPGCVVVNSPSEPLASKHMEEMLRELREQYDVILINTPPLFPITDAAAVAPATDGAILVCRFKQTTRTQVESAAEALRAVSAPLHGTVFTMVPSSGPRAYAQHNAYYQSEQLILSEKPVIEAVPAPNRRSSPTAGPAAGRPEPSLRRPPHRPLAHRPAPGPARGQGGR